MRRLVIMLGVSLALAAAVSAAPVAPIQVEKDPPYTDADFLQIAKSFAPRSVVDAGIETWWARAPGYLRARILQNRPEDWKGIIICNYFGFVPSTHSQDEIAACEAKARADWQRGTTQWNADGTFSGPSEECRQRNKRDGYGALICD